MTSSQFKEIQKKLGLTNVAMANVLGVSLQSVEKWRSGARPITKAMEKLIEFVNKENS